MEESLLERIEVDARHRISIETKESDDALMKCHPQTQSLVFTMLPREIRDLIWAFALAQYNDSSHKYKTNEYFYRPDRTARLKTHFHLLLACRRIWLEANALPMLQAEHSFWYYRAAPDARNAEWMARLTPQNRKDFGHLHLFAQMFAIEPLSRDRGRLRAFFLKSPVVAGDFQPRIFHVTIRHTDWWHWEMEHPLRLQDRWVHALLNSDDLRSTHILKLELETMDYKITQLEPIVERLRNLESEERKTHYIGGRAVTTRFVLSWPPTKYTWSGPSNIDEQTFSPYLGKSELKYHVVTLTWVLRFPEISAAYVPELRRAPRVGQEHLPAAESHGKFEPTLPEYSKYCLPGKDSWTMLHVEQESKYRDDVTECLRRNSFKRAMGSLRASSYEANWEAKGSLLKFED